MSSEERKATKTPLAEFVQVILCFTAMILGLTGSAVLWGLGGALLAGCVLCIVIVVLIGYSI